jgi:hypothetical protein
VPEYDTEFDVEKEAWVIKATFGKSNDVWRNGAFEHGGLCGDLRA